ncbi:MAG: MvaI/BcnI family restriction endonuclease [Candidatus Thorarchaeota archaeon]|nr:MvaI/BcnI family restriction endonuclease [Candidatus Thorarchaeota archaeon]
MTSIPEMTLEELVRRIEKIRDVGWIRSYRKGNTGVGHTMEGLLGLPETNVALPDWGLLEIKTTRRDSKTPITLMSKAPKLHQYKSRAEFMQAHGYWDEKRNRQALYLTLDAISENNRHWKMIVDKDNERILFSHNDEIVASQDFQSLEDKLSRKVSNLVLIIAERKREGKEEFFRYDEAYLLANADITKCIELIENGDITFDWRMHVKSDGTVRDHGPCYRMLETKMPKLFREKIRII